jgi:cobalt-zinc-cadmium efflux system outer membrane protein
MRVNRKRGTMRRGASAPARLLRSAVLVLVALHDGLAPASGWGQEPSQPTLTLGEVFQLIDVRSPRLEAARQMTVAAESRIRPARTLPDPQIQFGLMNRNLPGFGLQDPLGMNEVRVMQMIPIAGQLGLSGRIAEARAAATRARAGDLRWELRARSAMAFYELYQADRSLAIMEATRELVRDITATARTMYSVGGGRQADVLRAQVEVDRMTEEIARMRSMRQAAAARLNALVDRPSDTPIPSPERPRFPDALPSDDALEQRALTGRPMLAAAAFEVEASTQEQRRARRELWPDIQLGVVYGQRPMVDGTERMVSLMIGFSVPVWAGSRQLQMRRETDAMRLGAEAELTAMRAETRGRLGELVAALRRVRDLRSLYATTILPQAEAMVATTLSAYRVGEVDLPMLLEARMTVNRYHQQVVQLDAEEGTAWAEIEMLLGHPLFDVTRTGAAEPSGDTR